MKKLFLIIAGFLSINTALFTQNTSLPRVAVLEFSTHQTSLEVLNKAILVREWVETYLSNTNKYTMVSRTEINHLINNQRFQMSDIASDDNIHILKIVNISYMVTGSVTAMGSNHFNISVRLLDVTNGVLGNSMVDIISGSPREMLAGVNSLMERFTRAMATDERGAIVPVDSQRPQASGASIEVSTQEGGDLFLNGERIATLWDNDTHTIPIERPGSYALRLVMVNGLEKTRGQFIMFGK